MRWPAPGTAASWNPSGGPDTQAWRIALTWSLSFERPARHLTTSPMLPTTETGGILAAPELHVLLPGTPLAQATNRLAQSRLSVASHLPGMSVYQARLFDSVSLRQRLVLLHADGDLDAAALIVEFSNVNDNAATVREYARVRDALIKRYGQPERYEEVGGFSADVSGDLAQGRFARMLEWPTEGGWLRFGIPRRLDGQVRMEVLHSRRISAGASWGVEGLR
jgi:hypothetical protein